MWVGLFSSTISLFFLSHWELSRYRLKYCLKGPLNPKPTNQPINVEIFILKTRNGQNCICMKVIYSIFITAKDRSNFSLTLYILNKKSHQTDFIFSDDLLPFYTEVLVYILDLTRNTCLTLVYTTYNLHRYEEETKKDLVDITISLC